MTEAATASTATPISDPAFRLNVLVQGFPGKSVCHGGLGWSTIALIRDGERAILVDTGSFNARHNIHDGLTRLGLEPGQTAILNDPFTGGTHLPDVTLVSRTVLGFAVSRAHHADVGGIEPASLPAFSRTLEEEGVILPPQLLTDDVLERLLPADWRRRAGAARN